MNYLERYLNGEYEQIWDELFHLGMEVHHEDLYPDALAVARETMGRVRQNIEVLINRLVQIGFIFGYDHRIQPAFGAPYRLLCKVQPVQRGAFEMIFRHRVSFEDT